MVLTRDGCRNGKLRGLDDELVGMYCVEKLSLREVSGRLLGERGLVVSAQAIRKALVQLGVDTRKGVSCWVEVECGYCGEIFRRKRKSARGHIRHFCGVDCYHGWLGVNGGCEYKPRRHGQRLARELVREWLGLVELPEGSVVHHEDGDCWNNERGNLVLLRDQGDHVRWHRGVREEVLPLWVGWNEELDRELVELWR